MAHDESLAWTDVELYAKLIGLLLQHWLILLFAWQDEQRSLVKLARGASAMRLVLCWKLLQGTAHFSVFSKPSSAGCVPGVN